MERVSSRQNKQIDNLTAIFLAWKCLLLLIAASSPGPGYDTSALILLNPSHDRHREFDRWSRLDRLALNLFRWDALYFVKSAQRGYLYEQEWAFSGAYSKILGWVVKFCVQHPDPPLKYYVWAGIILSNFSHLCSVIALFKLLNLLLGNHHNSRISFIACILHVLSPAGLFLSAPYSEAFFALLNFNGILGYVQTRIAAMSSKRWTIYHDFDIISTGAYFGFATWIRSNGLLSGLLFLFDVVGSLPSIAKMRLSRNEMRRIVVTCIAGALMAALSVVPQHVAYQEFCLSDARPWCHRMIPSIYTWVQSEYWNVGFLRYWTLPNLPLFIMAAPMLWLLVQSTVSYLRDSTQQPREIAGTTSVSRSEATMVPETIPCNFPQVALPQLVLAGAATTNFHVQVINRLASGYPVWYLSVAKWMTGDISKQGKSKTGMASQIVVRGMIMYAIIQGALFAGFLPPA